MSTNSNLCAGIETGYWAASLQSAANRTAIHLALDGKPLCGRQISGDYLVCVLQVVLAFVECPDCLQAYASRLGQSGQAARMAEAAK